MATIGNAPNGDERGPRLYQELADWWPLFSSPDGYAREAVQYLRLLREACDEPPRTVLELGSGGGNTASHLKAQVELTLVDRSPEMLAVSRALNPECEHIEGDMRTVRLGRTFDAIFVHDAVAYVTTSEDLRATFETAFVHCRPSGAALFVPDYVRERFRPGSDWGGHDGADRAIRYLEWTWDPDTDDSTYVVDFAYLLRDERGEVRVEHDRHVCGLFPRDEWLRLLREVGFAPEVHPAEHGEEVGADLFLARKPA